MDFWILDNSLSETPDIPNGYEFGLIDENNVAPDGARIVSETELNSIISGLDSDIEQTLNEIAVDENQFSTAQSGVNQTLYKGGWLFGAWTPIYRQDRSLVDLGYETAFETSSPDFDANLDLKFDFGRYYLISRENIFDAYFGFQLLINDRAVATRTNAHFIRRDTRTNLGNETVVKWQINETKTIMISRENIPAGSNIKINIRNRHRAIAPQRNSWARFAVGHGRQASFNFTPRA